METIEQYPTHVKSLVSGLSFDEAAHKYFFRGEILPSVTTILHETNCSGRGFEKGGPPGMAAIRGTLVHSWGELTLDEAPTAKIKEIEGLLQEMDGLGYLTSLKTYWDRIINCFGHKVLLTEGKFVGPLEEVPLYAGTADLIFYDKDMKLTIADYKTGLQQPSHALQLCAYGVAVSAMTDTPFDKINLEAVYLSPNGGYVRKPFGFSAVLREEWASVCRTYWWQKRNGLIEK